ncbi:MAG: DUF1634 domain-containing protein [Chloroflexi bacterium]|nr:DUF1634 domain-containing protein [Chloroflexota bacterium]
MAHPEPTRVPHAADVDEATEGYVGITLLAGLLLSIAVMVLGLLLSAARGGSSHVLPLDQLLPHLARGDSAAVLDAGIILLFAAPLAGVVVALVGFARQRDTTFIVLSAALLVVLAAGFAVALR